MRAPDRSRLQRIADVALALFVGVFLVAVVLDPSNEDGSWLVLGLCLLAIGQGVALLWRWSHPRQVMAIAVVAGLPIQLYAPDTLFPAASLVALYALAATRPPWISLPALAAVLGLTAIAWTELPAGDIGFGMAIAAGVWALGEAARNRHKAITESTRRAVGEEQARIARELHDVIAHSVSVIVVQAAAADDVFDERPDQARAALRSIESAGREALAELRRLLAPVARPATTATHRRRSRASSASTSSSRRCARPASRWPSIARTRPARCPPASTCPPTASSRRR